MSINVLTPLGTLTSKMQIQMTSSTSNVEIWSNPYFTFTNSADGSGIDVNYIGTLGDLNVLGTISLDQFPSKQGTVIVNSTPQNYSLWVGAVDVFGLVFGGTQFPNVYSVGYTAYLSNNGDGTGSIYIQLNVNMNGQPSYNGSRVYLTFSFMPTSIIAVNGLTVDSSVSTNQLTISCVYPTGQSNAGLSNVNIYLWSPLPQSNVQNFFFYANNVTTDANGNATIKVPTNIALLNYNVMSTPSGYIQSTNNQQQIIINKTTSFTIEFTTPNTPQNLTLPIDVYTMLGYNLGSGSSQVPIPNVQVKVSWTDVNGNGQSQTVITNDSGNVSLLVPQVTSTATQNSTTQLIISFMHPFVQFSTITLNSESNVILYGGGAVTAYGKMPITLRMVDNNGNPLSGVSVQPVWNGTNLGNPLTTDNNGYFTYTMNQLCYFMASYQNYTFQSYSYQSGYNSFSFYEHDQSIPNNAYIVPLVQYSSGQITGDALLNFLQQPAFIGTIQTPQTYSISGYVKLQDGTGVNGVTISAGGATATTMNYGGQDGYYILTSLSQSNLTPTASANGYTFKGQGNNSTYNFTASYQVNVQVSYNGQGLSGMTVQAGSQTATTNSAGLATFTLSVGVARVTVSDPQNKYTFTYTNGNDVSFPITLYVTAAPYIQSNYYSVSGYITQSNGQAVDGVTVSANYSQSGFASVATTQTDELGHYSLNQVQGGLIIVPSLSGWAFQPQQYIVSSNMSNANFTAVPATYTITAVLVDSQTNAYLNGYITCNGQTYNSDTSALHTITIQNLSGIVNFTAYSAGYNSVTGTFSPSESGQQLVTISMPAYIYNVVIDFVNASGSAATLKNTNVNINITPD